MQTTAASSHTGPTFQTTSAKQQATSIGFYEVKKPVIFPSMHLQNWTSWSIFGLRAPSDLRSHLISSPAPTT
jgi:hypothetical protein